MYAVMMQRVRILMSALNWAWCHPPASIRLTVSPQTISAKAGVSVPPSILRLASIQIMETLCSAESSAVLVMYRALPENGQTFHQRSFWKLIWTAGGPTNRESIAANENAAAKSSIMKATG